MATYPKILSVTPIEGYQLQVTFRNHETKVYDCGDVLNQPAFAVLRDPAMFRAVEVDAGGYGVRWNDELDLSEAELWLHGKIAQVPETSQTPPRKRKRPLRAGQTD